MKILISSPLLMITHSLLILWTRVSERKVIFPFALRHREFWIIPNVGQFLVDLFPFIALRQKSLCYFVFSIDKLLRFFRVWIFQPSIWIDNFCSMEIINHALIPSNIWIFYITNTERFVNFSWKIPLQTINRTIYLFCMKYIITRQNYDETICNQHYEPHFFYSQAFHKNIFC